MTNGGYQNHSKAPDQATEEMPPTDQQLLSPLLRLPKEIRDMVYSHVFAAKTNWIRLDTAEALDAPLFSNCCSPLDDSHAMHVYGLILTCRQLYAETMHLYYPNAVFYLYNFNAAMRRIARMPAEYREAMTDLRICISPREEREEWGDIAEQQERERRIRDWNGKRLDIMTMGLEQAGIELREGVLSVGVCPPGLKGTSEDDEWSDLTAMFGRGPMPDRWRGSDGRDGLVKTWSRRTKDLTRYQSVMRHAVDMGGRGEKMRCWAEQALDL